MKKRILFYLAFLFTTSGLWAQNCLPEGLHITTQAQIDNFSADHPGCTEIEGKLVIVEAIDGEITNLNGLSSITSVGGNVEIWGNDELTSLSGLESLSSIGGNLAIQNNVQLVTLAALSNITEVPGNVYISECHALTNLNDLEGLTYIGEEIQIVDNASMTSLFDNSSLTTVGGRFNVSRNGALLSLEGMNNLTSVDNIFIYGNNALTNLNGLETITSLNGNLNIRQNDALISLSGLENLTTVGGNLNLYENEILVDLSGLIGITSVTGNLELERNDNLDNFTGLNNLSSIGGNVRIKANSGITTLAGLESITTIPGNLDIEINSSLLNFTGLESLTTIEGRLKVYYHHNLLNFTGLQNLTSIGGHFEITSNFDLTALNGLNSLTSIGGRIWMSQNHQLTNLNGLESLNSVDDVRIWNHSGLESLEGLESLVAIDGELDIRSNSSLVDLSGLENLTSIGAHFVVEFNADMVDLSGVENLVSVGDTVSFSFNEDLNDISATSNIDFTGTTSILIRNNPELSVCDQENICNYLMTGGDVTVLNNAPGCNALIDLLQACFEDIPHSNLVGQLVADVNMNCEIDGGEEGIGGWLVHVYNDDYSYAISTDSLGNYWLPVIPGTYHLNAISPYEFWTPCFSDSLVQPLIIGDSTTTDFLMEAQGECAYLDWNMTVPPLRVCQSRTIVIDYCNQGAMPAENPVFTVELDPNLTIDTASIPYIIDPDGFVIFEVETVDLFECGQFTMSVFLNCEGVNINDMICVDVELMSDELCSPDDLWDGSIVKATGQCENDSIYFKLENIGDGDMFEPAQFRVEIVIDDIILMMTVDDFQLNAGEMQTLSFENEGQGMRLEADQTEGHPVDNVASVVVPNCSEIQNNELLDMMPENNGDPYTESICVPAVNSYDPNIKTVSPEGLGENHEIKKDWELDYTIQFQNTGNDVAYLVVIRDTLSENLDLTTLSVRGASHSFTWALNPDRELVFTFEDILLPDSTSNEPESHGYVNYSITPKQTIIPGEMIDNRAGIYFDFNDPIITNTVSQTILKPVVASSEYMQWCEGEDFQGVEIIQDTTVQLLTSFIEYDSIHFVHLEVQPVVNETVTVDVLSGDYYEGILIQTDTSFVISYVAENGCDSLVTYDINMYTDVNEVNNAFRNVKVYPIPASDVLQVMNHQNDEIQNWSLMNNLGIMVWNTRLNANEKLPGIDVNDLPAGIYSLRVKTASGRKAWRVLIH